MIQLINIIKYTLNSRQPMDVHPVVVEHPIPGQFLI